MKKAFIGIFSLFFIGAAALFMAALNHSTQSLDIEVLSTEVLSSHCAEAIIAMQQPNTLPAENNCQIRQWYINTLTKIPAIIAQQDSSAKAAFCAYAIRHQARMTARTAMPSTEVALLRLRDLFTYGQFDGPVFKQLTGDKPVSDKKYQKIIASSQRSNDIVDAQCQLENQIRQG
ncbi:MAG: hypothetical protein HRU20_21845 [Pseudomonadales bacterium]|nr:hypothetical protein [Pseudomonadales bacterium]